MLVLVILEEYKTNWKEFPIGDKKLKLIKIRFNKLED